jgi:hypothetical protein
MLGEPVEEASPPACRCSPSADDEATENSKNVADCLAKKTRQARLGSRKARIVIDTLREQLGR